jgi:hypothetical protein
VAGHPILERASAAIESDELASAAGCHRRIRKAGLDLLNDSQFSHGGDASQKDRRVIHLRLMLAYLKYALFGALSAGSESWMRMRSAARRRTLTTPVAALKHARARPANSMQRKAPGYYRYRVGEIVVTDGERSAPLDDKFVLNATREEVASRKRVTD